MWTNSPVNTHLYAHRLVQLSNMIREVCLWSRQWLMQQLTTNQSAEDSYQQFKHNQGISITPLSHKAWDPSFQKRWQKERRARGQGETGAEQCLLDVTELLHSWRQSSCAVACTRPAQAPVSQHCSLGWGGIPESPPSVEGLLTADSR